MSKSVVRDLKDVFGDKNFNKCYCHVCNCRNLLPNSVVRRRVWERLHASISFDLNGVKSLTRRLADE